MLGKRCSELALQVARAAHRRKSRRERRVAAKVHSCGRRPSHSPPRMKANELVETSRQDSCGNRHHADILRDLPPLAGHALAVSTLACSSAIDRVCNHVWYGICVLTPKDTLIIAAHDSRGTRTLTTDKISIFPADLTYVPRSAQSTSPGPASPLAATPLAPDPSSVQPPTTLGATCPGDRLLPAMRTTPARATIRGLWGLAPGRRRPLPP